MSTPAPPSDLYAILGVPPKATPAMIDQAYRALVRRYHPDSRTTGDAALAVADDTRLRDVMAAYLVLGNPDRRADFDRAAAPSRHRPSISRSIGTLATAPTRRR